MQTLAGTSCNEVRMHTIHTPDSLLHCCTHCSGVVVRAYVVCVCVCVCVCTPFWDRGACLPAQHKAQDGALSSQEGKTQFLRFFVFVFRLLRFFRTSTP
mmetsp:Transcript_21357/g.35092  ORF Transcript_21357/g.35092 Transcript_21357/m.35092 type:complete len:99 (+) Transcript_21357:25-321(+)